MGERSVKHDGDKAKDRDRNTSDSSCEELGRSEERNLQRAQTLPDATLYGVLLAHGNSPCHRSLTV